MFKGSLYTHQVEAAEFLVNKKRVLLCHEQGLGKTVTAIAAFEKLRECKKADNCLILVEASYLFQWANAIERFTDSKYCIYKEHRRVYEQVPYTLISYNIWRNDFDFLQRYHYDCVITDEAQIFSNNKSKTSKLLKRYNVKQHPQYRWALTGTAIRNRLEQLYNIMYWVDNKFLPPWPVFERTHIVRLQTGISGYKNLEILNYHLKHRAHRRTHEDAKGSMPTIIGPIIHTLPPSNEYTKAQNTLLKTLDDLHEDLVISEVISPKVRSEVSKAFSTVRKLLSGTEKVKYLVKEIDKVLEESEENKIVVFSFYKDPLYLLGKSLKKIGIESVRYTGDESSEDKQQNIKRFANDVRVLLVSNAGCRGLDLPYANFVYHIDVPFSFDILDQRNKRITRLSSIHERVLVNYLITEASIEQFYFDIVLRQGELLKATFDEVKDKVKIKTTTLRQYLNDYRAEVKEIS